MIVYKKSVFCFFSYENQFYIFLSKNMISLLSDQKREIIFSLALPFSNLKLNRSKNLRKSEVHVLLFFIFEK